MKKTLRQFLHRERLVQVRVVDPNNLCDDLDDSMYTDPVHPPPVFYEKLAARLIAMQEGEGFSSADGRPERVPEPDPKRIKLISSSSGRGLPFRGGRGGGGRSGRASRGGPRGDPGAEVLEEGSRGGGWTGNCVGHCRPFGRLWPTQYF